MDLAFTLYLKLKANGFGFYFLKRNPNPLDLDTFLMKSKFAILDFSFRQLKSRNPKPIQTFVARGADPRPYRPQINSCTHSKKNPEENSFAPKKNWSGKVVK